MKRFERLAHPFGESGTVAALFMDIVLQNSFAKAFQRFNKSQFSGIGKKISICY